MRTFSTAARWVGLLAAAAAALAFIRRDALPYLNYSPAAYGNYWGERTWLIPHILAAGPAILIGPLQFLPAIRRRWPAWHRRLGWVFVGGALVGAPAAFRLAVISECVMCRPPLAILACLWFTTAVAAVWAARHRDFATHRQFMIRSYVLMNAFVIIRLSDVIPLPIPSDDVRRTLFEWLCWVVPLGITELSLTWWPALRRTRDRRVTARA